MTQICVSLTEDTTAAVIDRMADLAPEADLFEIRGDSVADLDLLTILRAKTKPLLFACRPRSEGGSWADTEVRRRMTLLEAVKRGFDYVDVEYRSEFLDVMMEKSGNGLVVSYHDLGGTPADLEGLYESMCRKGADIVKIAVTPRSVTDVGRLLQAAARLKGAPTPLVAVAMGPLGVISRIVAGRHQQPFTYASPEEGAEAAPGQIPLAAMSHVYRVRSVKPETRVYGVLGTGVTKSVSPLLHNRGFAALDLDAVYVPLEAESLEAFLAALPDLGLSGFSVTRPYKVAILPRLEEVEEAAALSGSVNTVTVHDGRLTGSTTDGIGVVAPLRKRIDIKGRLVIVLGAGGAARAAAFALKRKGARVTLLARDPQAAADAAASVAHDHGSLDSLPGRDWDVLVNATPVGSLPHPEETLVDPSLLRSGSIVFDMVYDPRETRLLKDARSAGCVTIDGLEMLLAQAVVQFEAWTGLEAPVEAMAEAAAQARREAP